MMLLDSCVFDAATQLVNAGAGLRRGANGPVRGNIECLAKRRPRLDFAPPFNLVCLGKRNYKGSSAS